LITVSYTIAVYPYIEEEQTTQWKRTNNDLQNIHIKLKIE